MLWVYSLYRFSLFNLPICNIFWDMLYTKTRHIQSSMSMNPRKVLSTYIKSEGMAMEIELRMQIGKKDVEEGWTTPANLLWYTLFKISLRP